MVKSRMTWRGLHLHELCDEELRTADLEVRECRAAVAIEAGEVATRGYDEDIAELAAHMADRGLAHEPMPAENPFAGKLRRSA